MIYTFNTSERRSGQSLDTETCTSMLRAANLPTTHCLPFTLIKYISSLHLKNLFPVYRMCGDNGDGYNA